MATNPAWDRQEVILACDLVVDNGWRELRTNNPKVQALSELLRTLSIHPAESRGENFRSPDSVSRKTTDLMTAHPDYPRARTRGSRTDREVVQEFIYDPAAMKAEAAAIRQAAMDNDLVQSRRSGVAQGLTAEHISAALDEWRRLGRDAFMVQYGGNPAERYLVVTESEEVDALALLLGARALAGLDTTGSWRGDRASVAEPLIALGFQVDAADRQESPEVQDAEAVVQLLAGRTRRQGRGQGFSVDQDSKLAIEGYAMARARRHFAQLGTVVNTSSRRSWDYEVDINGTIWHVEVKGTTGDPVGVILTPNEVVHARAYKHVALFVVSNIDVRVGSGNKRSVVGGKVTIYQPWTIDRADLTPLGYKYRLPAQGESPPE